VLPEEGEEGRKRRQRRKCDEARTTGRGVRRRRWMRISLLAVAAVGFCSLGTLFFWQEAMRRPEGPIRPQQFRSLVIYDVDFPDAATMSPAALSAKVAVTLDQSVTEEMFSHTAFHSGNPVWKGSSLGIASLDGGSTCRIRISYYGGFFKVLGQSGYYTVEGESRTTFETTYRGIIERDFLPARKRGGSSVPAD
jgi:hypothetical protein